MSDRATARLGVTVGFVSIALASAGLVLVSPYWHVPRVDLSQQAASAFIGVTFSAVGAFLVWKRPRNTVGWIFLAIGLSQSISVFALYGEALNRSGRPSSLAQWLNWVESWSWSPGYILIPTLLLQLFPDGKPLAARWRWVERMTVLSLGLLVLGLAFARQPDFPRTYRSPVPTSSAVGLAVVVGGILLLFCLVASVVSIVQRYRRSRGEQREQLKWFVYAALATVLLLTLTSLAPFGLPNAVQAVTFVAVPLMPAATAVAILKYRLYDIDVVINKTVVYATLAAFITLVYVAIVVGIGAGIGQGSSPNLGLSILATALVAVAFQPVRERVQKLANRLVYGKRATPYEVLSEFSSRMAGAFASEDLLPRMARILAEGTGAQSARVWLVVGNELRSEAAWPADGQLPTLPLSGGELPEVPDASMALSVHHRGELLGALSLVKPAGERLSPAEEHLARDLAAGAGLVLRNVRLTEELLARLEELRASRQRIVAAQDQERRRLERNIHDGSQQQLVALAVKVRLARSLLGRDPGRATGMLSESEAEVSQALEDLRDLARGIYPPLLADQGLVSALEAQARRSSVRVSVEADGIGRYGQDAEAAVYFCVLEALQNVAKYANASSVAIGLTEQDGQLEFEVRDDGRGFDLAQTSYGTGLQGMADRLSALGGELHVSSVAGGGTTVTGRLPVRALEPVG